ncbi:SMP-30/gluconolactonase/LRE family protein [Pyxidicoccus sp. 3LFB2]
MRLILSAALSTCLALTGCGSASAENEEPLGQQSAELRAGVLVVPGDNFYPESVAIAPNGTLFTSSITTGQIVKYAPFSSTAQTFVKAGVNVGTAGIFVDAARNTLWACAVDLSFATPTALRAFDLGTGALTASYTVPDGGVCGDIAMARGDVYFTDTLVPRIFRVRWPAGGSNAPASGTLELWSTDPLYSGEGFLQINGLAFDGLNTFYTNNYSTGTVVKVKLKLDGTATAATQLPGAPFSNPDGIRMLDVNTLLVTENAGALTKVNVNTGARTVVTSLLDQPTSVVVEGRYAWVSEGQVLRLQQGIPPNLPFKLKRVPLWPSPW